MFRHLLPRVAGGIANARAPASRDSGLQNPNPSVIRSHCRRSVQRSPGWRTGENTISVSCSRLQYSCRCSSSSSRLFSSRRSYSSPAHQRPADKADEAGSLVRREPEFVQQLCQQRAGILFIPIRSKGTGPFHRFRQCQKTFLQQVVPYYASRASLP